MRIGALARAAGTTVRTVRYYEEIGLLPASGERVAGEHREYDEVDVARLQELLRLKGLLGLSLDELRDVIAGEEARVQRRREWHETSDPDERQR
ncbi:MAG TPA: MerR family transcriptional regulator, partial [Solirubrobacter sp.]|nr:MerR family transcriptional regulator [Solirubrobacter sp.]